MGRSVEAVGAATRAVELYERLPPKPHGDSGPPWWRLARSHHHLGRALIAAGRHGEAIAAYRKALELLPEQAMFNNDLAWMLVNRAGSKARDPSEAVLVAAEATKLNPKAANNWNTLGVARYRAGDHGAAISALAEVGRVGTRIRIRLQCLLPGHGPLGNSATRDEARVGTRTPFSWMEKSKPKRRRAPPLSR